MDFPNHLPTGISSDAKLKNNIEPGHLITFDDIEITESLTFKAWLEVKEEVLQKQKDVKRASDVFS